MDLNTSIEELKLALQNSDAFCRYQKIREEVHHYPEKEHRLHEFRRKNYFLQNSKDQIDLFTEADRLEQEGKPIGTNRNTSRVVLEAPVFIGIFNAEK